MLVPYTSRPLRLPLSCEMKRLIGAIIFTSVRNKTRFSSIFFAPKEAKHSQNTKRNEEMPLYLEKK